MKDYPVLLNNISNKVSDKDNSLLEIALNTEKKPKVQKCAESECFWSLSARKRKNLKNKLIIGAPGPQKCIFGALGPPKMNSFRDSKVE